MVLDNVTDAKKNLEGISEIEIRSSSRDSSSEGHEGNDQSEKVPIAQHLVSQKQVTMSLLLLVYVKEINYQLIAGK